MSEALTRLPLVARAASTNLSSKRWSVSTSGSTIGSAMRMTSSSPLMSSRTSVSVMVSRRCRVRSGKRRCSSGSAVGRKIGRDRWDGPKLQRPREHPLAMLGVIEQVAHRGKDGAPAPDDLLALLGQLDPRFSPLDEADLELILQFLDLHAEGRLGDGAGLRRLAEMQRLRQCFEITQLPQGHHGDKGRFGSISTLMLR